jgi:hypothetical protein
MGVLDSVGKNAPSSIPQAQPPGVRQYYSGPHVTHRTWPWRPCGRNFKTAEIAEDAEKKRRRGELPEQRASAFRIGQHMICTALRLDTPGFMKLDRPILSTQSIENTWGSFRGIAWILVSPFSSAISAPSAVLKNRLTEYWKPTYVSNFRAGVKIRIGSTALLSQRRCRRSLQSCYVLDPLERRHRLRPN